MFKKLIKKLFGLKELPKLTATQETSLKTFSIQDIRSWKPCYDPSRHLSEDWKGTVIDVLRHDKIPSQDKLWCVFRTSLLSEKIMRLFAVWATRQALSLVTDPDPRSIKACDTAEAYALGKATKEELAAAYDAAYDANAAYSAANAAAYSAANAAAYDAREKTRKAQVEKLIEMILAEVN